MKTLLLGNAGSGKSTLARKLLASQPEAQLIALDDLAFSGGIERRPLDDSVAAALDRMASSDHWVVEGCYADIFEPLLVHGEQLIFLNPGVEACVGHCQSRPWEPDKFATREAQDAHLDKLVSWVRSYETRADEYGLKQHRALFDTFSGEKIEYRAASDYETL